LTPGALARALHAAFGIPGETLRALEPEDRGVFRVLLDASRARDLETPALLAIPTTEGGSLLGVLGRPTDPIDLSPARWRLSPAPGAPTPAPGVIARALAALDCGLGGEQLGLLWADGPDLVVALPPAADVLSTPTRLDTDGQPLTLHRAATH
jgi:hypothetical protein